MADLLFKDEVYKIIGAAMEVHNELGYGFLEAVYQEALEIEFEERGIPYHKEKEIEVYYKNLRLKKGYKADFLCFEEIIVELKTSKEFCSQDVAQLLNYLKATETKVGLLINFGKEKLEYKQLIF
ncbi:MAG: GxxExxY protein [Salinivirgaceae bacterium]|jgi:GxxExxY protein